MIASPKFQDLRSARPRAESLAACLGLVPGPRVDRTKKHVLGDLLFTAVCALLCGYHSPYDMEEFGLVNLAWLRQYVPLANGVPSHDTFRRVLGLVAPRHVLNVFRLWTAAALGGGPPGQIAIDGKALRRARDAGGAVPYIVNAWSARSRLMLGGEQVLDKENEIKAIPRVLGWLDLDGALVSIDAIGCQTRIAADIRARGGDWLLALKDNHPAVRDEMETFLAESVERGERHVDTFESADKGHGRLERRVFLSSRRLSAREALEAVRAHWGVESAHWVLDIAFEEDASRARTGHAPVNLAHLRRMTYNLLRAERDAAPADLPPPRFKALQRRAARDDAFRSSLLENFLNRQIEAPA